MRRQLADILGLGHEAGMSWLQYARLCRSTGECIRIQRRAAMRCRSVCECSGVTSFRHEAPSSWDALVGLPWSVSADGPQGSGPPSHWDSFSRCPQPTSAGQPEAAATATLEAIARQAPGAVLERAKLLLQMGKQHRAIEEVKVALKA